MGGATLRHEIMPPDEAARLAAVRRYDILDTPPDGAFDRITSLAARICQVPISTITIVDADRIWFKSTVGVEVDEIGRDPGLCASAILGELPYTVVDASVDPRTLDNPLVRGDLGLRFYVGVPLTTTDGHNLGTLNIIDTSPREVDPHHLAILQDLAAVVMDELELRLAARRAVEVEAAREALRLRDAVLAGISHEMRTPLAVLNGIVGVEEADHEPGDPERDQLRTMMRRHVRHLDWLLTQFLDYASLEGDRPPVVSSLVTDLVPLVAEAIDVFADRCPIVFRRPDEPVMAIADPDRTWQICLELLNNAVRFSPNQSQVDIEVARADNGQVRYTVSDRGPGIDMELAARLFEPMARHQQSTGSGVGLYVSRILAEAQGGSIEVESHPGEGSRFSLLLPAAG